MNLFRSKTTTPNATNSMNPSPLRRALLLLPLTLVCFALSPPARAVTPAPDGGYPNDNTAEGQDALFQANPGLGNTALGFNALYHNTGLYNTATGSQALFSNTVGAHNTATGNDALFENSKGNDNTATGDSALLNNRTGHDNTATGFQALNVNMTGSANTATGVGALERNETGHDNTANGVNALTFNTSSNNTATGYNALSYNTTGSNNTANGYQALFGDNFSFTSTGSNNTANGYRALYSYTIGGSNTANGVNALFSNTSGSFNTANGRGALNKNTTASNNTAEGYQALFNNTGSNNIGLGSSAGINLTTGDNNIDIGNAGVGTDANTIRIGTSQTNTYIAGISGVTVAGGVGVIVDSSGHLGTVVSSARFKDEIKPMDKASEAILALKPVTFRYKHELDPDGIPQFGLVAEEVEKVNPDLVARDAKGEVYSVRYEAVNAMLLNEFLKEHRKNEKQEATIARLEKQIEALTAGLQKLSAQLEVSKSAPQMVSNQ